MAIIVVGGSGRGAGKTALICGLLQALPEFGWTAVKITRDAHELPKPIWEERQPDGSEQGSDTARYLAAGARRSLLVTADETELGPLVPRILTECAQAECLIFESNSVLRYLRPDLCLAVASNLSGAHKPSFKLVEQCMNATVTLGGHNHVIEGERIHFHLQSLDRISPTMLEWLRERLGNKTP